MTSGDGVAAVCQALRAGDKSLVGNQGYRRSLRNTRHQFEVDEAKLQSEARHDGLWVLPTNTTLASATVALRYKELWRVERLIREAKSLVRTRPVYHRLDEPIRGDVFCRFLALVLVRELGWGLEAAGVRVEWPEVLRDLKALQRMELQEGTSGCGCVGKCKVTAPGCSGRWILALPPVLHLAEPKAASKAWAAVQRKGQNVVPKVELRFRNRRKIRRTQNRGRKHRFEHCSVKRPASRRTQPPSRRCSPATTDR